MFRTRKNLIFSDCTTLHITNLVDKCDLGKLIDIDYDESITETTKLKIRELTDAKSLVDTVENKINLFLPKLIHRFAIAHNIRDVSFWKQALFFYLKDLIGATHWYFTLIEAVYDPTLHELNIAKLPEHPPLVGACMSIDPEYSHVHPQGAEYYVGEYFRLFYSGKHKEIALNEVSDNLSDLKKDKSINKNWPTINYILTATYAWLVSHFFYKRARVVICNVQADIWYLWSLLVNSHGKVVAVAPPSFLPPKTQLRKINTKLRKFISSPPPRMRDRYECYLYACLENSLPWSLAEGFDTLYSGYNEFWSKFENLKFVLSEIYYQEHSIPLAMAVHNNKEIVEMPHFYPLENHYAHKLTEILTKNYKKISRGNFQIRVHNNVISGSVYRFKRKIQTKTIPILYVATDFYQNLLPFEMSYSGNGYYACKEYTKFVRVFFEYLPSEILGSINIKIRPDHLARPLSLKYVEGVRLVDRNSPATKYIVKSRLVLVEGLSTAFFEALASNVPCVAFWPEIVLYSSAYNNYWRSLMDAEMIFIDPAELAHHVKRIHENPEKWWHSKRVQEGRDRFLEDHLHQYTELRTSLSKVLRTRM